MPTVADNLSSAIDLLKAWGYPAKRLTGWRARRARQDITFDPKGVIVHHTAAWTTSNAMLFKAGNGRVPAPLCHFTIYRNGTVALGAAGYANHAGINNRPAVAKVLAGAGAEIKPDADTAGYSANRATIGVEVKCPGKMNAAQHKAAVALSAALVVAFSWDRTAVPVGAHKEITRRKPGDPGDDMGKFRREVVALIADKTSLRPAAPKYVWPTLKRGSHGDLVLLWKRAVKRRHPILAAKYARRFGDGHYRITSTYRAVDEALTRRIEERYGRKATGLVRHWMWRHLGLAKKVRREA